MVNTEIIQLGIATKEIALKRQQDEGIQQQRNRFHSPFFRQSWTFEWTSVCLQRGRLSRYPNEGPAAAYQPKMEPRSCLPSESQQTQKIGESMEKKL